MGEEKGCADQPGAVAAGEGEMLRYFWRAGERGETGVGVDCFITFALFGDRALFFPFFGSAMEKGV